MNYVGNMKSTSLLYFNEVFREVRFGMASTRSLLVTTKWNVFSQSNMAKI